MPIWCISFFIIFDYPVLSDLRRYFYVGGIIVHLDNENGSGRLKMALFAI